jgi:hypothetical protein
LPISFVVKKRLKNARRGFRIHTGTGVAHRQHDVRRRVEVRVGCLDRQAAAFRHGIAGVDRQVHDHLLDLARVDLHKSEIGGTGQAQFHVLPNQTTQQFLQIPRDAVEVDSP